MCLFVCFFICLFVSLFVVAVGVVGVVVVVAVVAVVVVVVAAAVVVVVAAAAGVVVVVVVAASGGAAVNGFMILIVLGVKANGLMRWMLSLHAGSTWSLATSQSVEGTPKQDGMWIWIYRELINLFFGSHRNSCCFNVNIWNRCIALVLPKSAVHETSTWFRIRRTEELFQSINVSEAVGGWTEEVTESCHSGCWGGCVLCHLGRVLQ